MLVPKSALVTEQDVIKFNRPGALGRQISKNLPVNYIVIYFHSPPAMDQVGIACVLSRVQRNMGE